MGDVKPQNVIGFLLGAVSTIGFTTLVLVHPVIRHRFDPAEYLTISTLALLMVTAPVVAVGLKLFTNVKMPQGEFAKFAAKRSFYYGVVPLLATIAALITHSWVLFAVIMIVGTTVGLLSK